MTAKRASQAMADLRRYLVGARGDRAAVWLDDGTRYTPSELPPSALVITPQPISAPAAGHEIVVREGDLARDCELLVIDGAMEIAVMDYSLAAFLPVAGPTLIRLATREEWELFLQDADAASTTGCVPAQLIHPMTVLEDADALTTGTVPQTRLTVSSTGVHHHLPGTDRSPAQRDRGDRAWLPRYLTIINALTTLHTLQEEPVEISGLGMRLSETSPQTPVEPADAPIIVRSRAGIRCLIPGNGRMLSVSTTLATILETLMTLPNDTDLAHVLDLPPSTIYHAVASLSEAGLISPREVVCSA